MIRIGEIWQLWLGYQGENKTRKIQIDAGEWLEQYPEGTITIIHRRHGETNVYPAGAEVDEETGVLEWVPTSADTEIPGEGTAVIVMSAGESIKLSKDITTIVTPSSAGEQPEDPPEEYETWIGTVLALKNAAQAAKAGADAARVAAEDARDAADAAAEDANRSKEAAYNAAESILESAERITENAENIEILETSKVDIDQGTRHAGKVLYIGANGKVTPVTTNSIDITATRLKTARTISLGGDASGITEFDGSENVEIRTAVHVMTNEELEEILNG